MPSRASRRTERPALAAAEPANAVARDHGVCRPAGNRRPCAPDRYRDFDPAARAEPTRWPLERLLDHNRGARIVWLHAGWDLSGERSVALMRGPLERHANLAMNIRYDHGGARERSVPAHGGELRPGWIAMLREYPDRFMIGSDQFFADDTERLAGVRRLVDALPPDLKVRIASDNAQRIYRLV